MNVSINSIQKTLGEPSNSLSGVCKSKYINRWSLKKPYSYIKYSPLEDSEIKSDIHCGLNIPTNALAYFDAKNTSTKWEYVKPSSCFRISDFKGYAHGAEQPIIGVKESSRRPTFSMRTGQTYKFVLQLTQGQPDGSITLSDLIPRSLSSTTKFTTSLDSWYFGVAIYRDKSYDEWSSVTTTWCSICYLSNNSLGNATNGEVTISDVSFAGAKTIDNNATDRYHYYMVFFLTPTKFSNVTSEPTTNTDASQIANIIPLENGVMKVELTPATDNYRTWVWDENLYKITSTKYVSYTPVSSETVNTLGDFYWYAISFMAGKNNTIQFEAISDAYKDNGIVLNGTSYEDRQVRLSLFDIDGWISNFVPDSPVALPTMLNSGNHDYHPQFVPFLDYYDNDSHYFIGLLYCCIGYGDVRDGEFPQKYGQYAYKRYLAVIQGGDIESESGTYIDAIELDTVVFQRGDGDTTNDSTEVDAIKQIFIGQTMDLTQGTLSTTQSKVVTEAGKTYTGNLSKAEFAGPNSNNFNIGTSEGGGESLTISNSGASGYQTVTFLWSPAGSCSAKLSIEKPLYDK